MINRSLHLAYYKSRMYQNSVKPENVFITLLLISSINELYRKRIVGSVFGRVTPNCNHCIGFARVDSDCQSENMEIIFLQMRYRYSKILIDIKHRFGFDIKHEDSIKIDRKCKGKK